METKLAIFEQKEIRKVWNSEEWDWYFSIVDIIEALTESSQPRRYWAELKKKLNEEWSELFDVIEQLKMKARDWKYYLTDVWDTKTILRLIQSIPSKKPEPFKMWLVRVWDERINEIYDPELAFERAISYYRKRWWNVAWVARKQLEKETKKKVISKSNFLEENKKLK